MSIVLLSDTVSDWYYLQDLDTNAKFIVESFNSKRVRSVEPKKAIQGFPGVLIMDIDGSTWTTTVSGNALVIKTQNYYDIFDLLIGDYNNLKQFLVYQNKNLSDKNLLASANISIDQSVSISLTYNQFVSRVFNVSNNLSNTTNDFVGRVAKFYDLSFFVGKIDGTNQFLDFKIHSGSIDITFDYDKLFFVNSDSEYPFYSPQFYKVSGTIKGYIPLSQITDFETDPVKFGELIPSLANCSLGIGNRYLELGQVNIQTELSIGKQNGLIEVDFSFTAYARYFEEK